MKKQINPASPKKKRFFLLFIAILLLVGIVTISINAYICASVKDQIITLEEASSLDADAILVLGARVWDNGEPSGILKDRISTGIDLFEAGASDRMLMSGDHGQDDYDEVNAMKDYAVEQGVPSSSIFLDHAGFSTYESVYRARDIFQVQTVVIVTQQYHLYRALYIANKMGLTAYGVASDRRLYDGILSFEAREILARIKDFVYTIFMPLPTYLGDVIPISGDGNTTNG